MDEGVFSFPQSRRSELVKSSPIRDILNVIGRGDVISFAGGIPDATLFEYSDIADAYAWVLAHQGPRALQYASTPGEPELREAAATRLSRQLPTTADQIQVTTGSQEALYLVGQAMVTPGDVVLVEQPTYLAAVQAFQLAGATLIGIPTDEQGVLPDELEKLIVEHKPAYVYLIPTFQNPSGRTMGLERRQAVAEVLVRTKTALVEDDPYGEIRFEGDRVPSMAAMPGMSGQTLLLNSISKVMAPGMRIGWIRGEGDIMRNLEVIKQAVALQCPVVDQLAVARYLDVCDLDEHIAKVVEAYRVRRDAMYDALVAMLPEDATVTRPVGGMFLWASLGHGMDTQQLLAKAVDKGVAFVPGWSFYAHDPETSTMRLSYVTNEPGRIREGLSRLKGALQEMGYPVR